MTVEWVNVKDRLPEEDGLYIVVGKYFGFRTVDVLRFATNLHEFDEYDFPKERRPGWVVYDDETGYFERTNITHWAELPELPDDAEQTK